MTIKRKGILMKLLMWKKVFSSLVVVASLGSALALESNEEITILQGLQEDENFTTLVSLLESSGLSEQLSAAGDITLFAPTNAAFEALGEEQLSGLAQDTAALTDILNLHVLEGAYTVLDLDKVEEGSLSSLGGEAYVFEQSAGGLMVNGSGLESTDVDNVYSNGIVQVVSSVILPESMQAAEDAATDDAATDTATDSTTESEETTDDTQ
jgi:uncharacterized surface protein with fasciclin (FAS1) repeats